MCLLRRGNSCHLHLFLSCGHNYMIEDWPPPAPCLSSGCLSRHQCTEQCSDQQVGLMIHGWLRGCFSWAGASPELTRCGSGAGRGAITCKVQALCCHLGCWPVGIFSTCVGLWSCQNSIRGVVCSGRSVIKGTRTSPGQQRDRLLPV